jgi:hypothetical protein
MWIRMLQITCLAMLLTIAAPASRAQQAAEASDSNSLADGSQDVAQQSAPGTAAASAPQPTTIAPVTHRFWDKENDLLFAAVGAGRALDYASTLNLRRRGINEAFLTNSIVDNHPLFAGIEVGATAASIGVSYLFHRTGHHRLERWTSAIHFGVATGGSIRNYLLKTPH